MNVLTTLLLDLFLYHHYLRLYFVYFNAQDYLPKDLYHRVLGSLVDDVLAQIIMRLLKLTDIAEAETHKLYEILILMFTCENLFDAEVILR